MNMLDPFKLSFSLFLATNLLQVLFHNPFCLQGTHYQKNLLVVFFL